MKKVLIKLSGKLLSALTQNRSSSLEETHTILANFNDVIGQIKTLSTTHQLAFVIGGGNFFRARSVDHKLAIRQPVADSVGMLATIMNGLLLQECFEQQGIPTICLSAIHLPSLTQPINQSTIDQAEKEQKCIIFCGGTSNPYFTTDTNAILRALHIGAQEVWKATDVDYIYDGDPKQTPTCKPLAHISYQDVIQKKLALMDTTAITLAQQHNIKIRIFNIFTKNALLTVANNSTFGSIIE